MPTPVAPPPRFSWTKGSTLFEKFRDHMGGWTQERMAGFVGVSVWTWRNWEQGQARPNMKRTETLNRLATEQGFKG